MTYTQLPFAPGKSPFRAKGNMFVGSIEAIQKHISGGLASILSHEAREESRAVTEFFQQKFHDGNWYDVGPLVVLSEMTSRYLKQRREEILTLLAHEVAERDMQGVFKWLLRIASPSMIAEKMPSLLSMYFESAHGKAKRLEKNTYQFEIFGIPEYLAVPFIEVTTPFIRRVFEKAGAQHIETTSSVEGIYAQEHGVSMAQINRTMSWSNR